MDIYMFFFLFYSLIFFAPALVVLMVLGARYDFNPANIGYPVRVVLHEKRADGVNHIKVHAKRVKDRKTGRAFYHIREKGMKTKPIPYDHIHTGNYAVMVSTGPEDYRPAIVEERNPDEEGSIKPIPEDVRNWQALNSKEADLMYPDKEDSKLLKLIPALTLIALCIGMALVFYFAFKGIGDMTGQMGSYVVQLGEIVAKAQAGSAPAIVPPPF